MTHVFLAVGLHDDPAPCEARLHGFPSLQPRPSDGAALAGCHSHHSHPPSFSLLLSPGTTFSAWSWTAWREMRCSTARYAGQGCAQRAEDAPQIFPRLPFGGTQMPIVSERFVLLFLQKRTWESNKNDIRICRMKGKHEVRLGTLDRAQRS